MLAVCCRRACFRRWCRCRRADKTAASVCAPLISPPHYSSHRLPISPLATHSISYAATLLMLLMRSSVRAQRGAMLL